jgi:beta-galactosidase
MSNIRREPWIFVGVFVRIAEFAWSRMEPSEGHYDLDWIDRAITTASAAASSSITRCSSPFPSPASSATRNRSSGPSS